uniref:Transmembrane protein 126A n=1 Tax=Crocodylus porosus TaxID=8502 RepID=A0A7M4FFP5_CROPO
WDQEGNLHFQCTALQIIFSLFRRKLFEYGSIFLGLGSGVCGFIANHSFRRILNISQAGVVTTLSAALIPLSSTVGVYNSLVIGPLLAGDLSCLSCAVVRGGLIGSGLGVLYPMAWAVFLNGFLATRYNTAPLPRMGNILRFWITASRPVYKKMSLALALQTMTGAYLGLRSHRTYMKMCETAQTEKWS